MLLENIGTSVLVSKDQVICDAFLGKNIIEEGKMYFLFDLDPCVHFL